MIPPHARCLKWGCWHLVFHWTLYWIGTGLLKLYRCIDKRSKSFIFAWLSQWWNLCHIYPLWVTAQIYLWVYFMVVDCSTMISSWGLWLMESCIHRFSLISIRFELVILTPHFLEECDLTKMWRVNSWAAAVQVKDLTIVDTACAQMELNGLIHWGFIMRDWYPIYSVNSASRLCDP